MKVSKATQATVENRKDYSIISHLPEDQISTCAHFHLQPQAKDTPSTRLVRLQHLQRGAVCPSVTTAKSLFDSQSFGNLQRVKRLVRTIKNIGTAAKLTLVKGRETNHLHVFVAFIRSHYTKRHYRDVTHSVFFWGGDAAFIALQCLYLALYLAFNRVLTLSSYTTRLNLSSEENISPAR
jgi:hypothetical protein